MMSRIIVKNLPKKVTQEGIKKHFSQIGTVTDVKLAYKKNGDFRGYAFLGYEEEGSVEKACDYFKDTYFQQNKIIVQPCSDLDYLEKKAALREEAKKEQLNKNEEKNKIFDLEIFQKARQVTKEKLKKYINDPDFIQYMKVHEKGASNLIQCLKEKYGQMENSGELSQDHQTESNSPESGNVEDDLSHTNSMAMSEMSDLEYLQRLIKGSETSMLKDNENQKGLARDLLTVVIRTREKNTNRKKKGMTFNKSGVKEFLKPVSAKSIRIPRKLSYVAYVGVKTEWDLNKVLMKDKGFLNGVRVRVHKYCDPETDKKLQQGEPPWKAAEVKLQENASAVADTGKLFIRNLWYSVTEEELKKHLEKIGPIADIDLPVSKQTRRPKGFAHVSYVFPEHAVRAMNELNGTAFKGRLLHVLPSIYSEDDNATETPKNFREQRQMEKSASSSDWHNWNSLFLGSSAVANLMAEQYGATKQRLFEDQEGQSAAITLALGETRIIDETKKFLEEQGISLEAFKDPSIQRSSTIILVKNLPAKTSAQELKRVFGEHGELGRVVLPPSGITAVVEFLDPGEAKKCFKKLAYSRFKDLPLYLEWAPVSVFKSGSSHSSFKTPPTLEAGLTSADAHGADTSNSVQQSEEKTDVSSSSNLDGSCTLYIKNLNFKTKEEDLEKFFSSVGEVASTQVARRRTLSQGFGFVQFVHREDAKKALKQLDGVTLHDHQLTLKMSEKILINQIALRWRKPHKPGQPVVPKLLVKNVPFQATQKEVTQLFKTFGELKLVRLPQKAGVKSEHRGFGFVEFVTMEDAKRCFEALSSGPHLYGRRLVLEWAKEEDTVEEIRKKATNDFLNAASSSARKKRKVEIAEENDEDG